MVKAARGFISGMKTLSNIVGIISSIIKLFIKGIKFIITNFSKLI